MRVVIEEKYSSYSGYAKGAEHNLTDGDLVEVDFDDWQAWLETTLRPSGERHEELTLTVMEVDGATQVRLWNSLDIVTRQFTVLCQDDSDHKETLRRLQQLVTAQV